MKNAQFDININININCCDSIIGCPLDIVERQLTHPVSWVPMGVGRHTHTPLDCWKPCGVWILNTQIKFSVVAVYLCFTLSDSHDSRLTTTTSDSGKRTEQAVVLVANRSVTNCCWSWRKKKKRKPERNEMLTDVASYHHCCLSNTCFSHSSCCHIRSNFIWFDFGRVSTSRNLFSYFFYFFLSFYSSVVMIVVTVDVVGWKQNWNKMKQKIKHQIVIINNLYIHICSRAMWRVEYSQSLSLSLLLFHFVHFVYSDIHFLRQLWKHLIDLSITETPIDTWAHARTLFVGGWVDSGAIFLWFDFIHVWSVCVSFTVFQFYHKSICSLILIFFFVIYRSTMINAHHCALIFPYFIFVNCADRTQSTVFGWQGTNRFVFHFCPNVFQVNTKEFLIHLFMRTQSIVVVRINWTLTKEEFTEYLLNKQRIANNEKGQQAGHWSSCSLAVECCFADQKHFLFSDRSTSHHTITLLWISDCIIVVYCLWGEHEIL